jgi:glycosyltransferase involved in cell wall biosynthesis
MRILIANAHRNLVGGIEKYLQAVIPGLLERGHDVGLLYEYRSDPESGRVDPAGGSLRTWCLAEGGYQAALRSVAKWKPDIVYSQGLAGPESVTVENALLDAFPVVLFVHNYDFTCGSGSKCHSFPEPKSCNRKLGPMCLVLYYPRRCGGLHPVHMWNNYRRHTRLNARLSDHQAILVASTHMHSEIARHGINADKLHLAPLPNTDVSGQPIPPATKRLTGNILFVGRLTDVKGVHYLIQAIPKAASKLNRPLRLTVAGDGPEQSRLKDLAHRLGVAVEFAGWVQTQQKADLMHHADLLAVPSLWPEPFGLVGIEAGSLGLPAVGYASGGIPDWLVPGETGELAPSDPPTVDGLSDAIVRAFASGEHHAKLCLGAWKQAQRFTLEKHLAQLEPLLGIEPSHSGRPAGNIAEGVKL